MKVAVIGAGIVGASFAYHLSSGGADVVLIDSGRPAGGTSTATAAYLNHLRKEPQFYSEFHVEGIAYWRELADRLELQHALHLDGALYWSDTTQGAAGLDRLVERSNGQGKAMEAADLKRLEPSLKPPYSEPPYRVTGEGWVEVAPVIERLISSAQAYGLKTMYQQPVTGIERRADQFHVYVGEEQVIVDKVVLAVGAETEAVGRLLGLELPVIRKPGVIAVTAPQAETLTHVLMTPGFSCRPDGGGRLLISVGERYAPTDGELNIDQAKTLREELQKELGRWLPGAGSVPIEVLRIGVRPIPADDLPIVGYLPQSPGVYLAVSHSAINLAPLIARLGSEEILTTQRPPALENFRPERFSSLNPSLQEPVHYE